MFAGGRHSHRGRGESLSAGRLRAPAQRHVSLPVDTANAFVPLGSIDLDTILCQQAERVIAPENTVRVAARSCKLPAAWPTDRRGPPRVRSVAMEGLAYAQRAL